MGELSWTVAPAARGKNLGQQMLHILADQIKFPLYAEIKVGNIPSIKIAESIGMTLQKEDNGILEYVRSKY